jgi:hypothetical protein
MSVIEVVVWVLILAVVPVCAATWLLWMRHRDGRVRGAWRHLFVVLCLLASWYVVMAFVVMLGGQTEAGMMLSLLWIIAGLSWGAIALGNHRHGSRTGTTVNVDANDAFAQVMARKRRAYAMYVATPRRVP